MSTSYHAPAVLVATALAEFGTPAMLGLVPGIIGGTTKACWAFTEPQTGSDPKQMTTRAERDGNEWVLHGEKTFITLAPLADHALVFVKTPDDRLSAVLVDTHQPGWQPGPPFEFLAFGGAATSPVHLDGVRAPLDNLVGDPGQGFDILLRGEAAGKIRAAATCVGIAQRAQELAVAYALDRTHRGAPIGEKFQTIQWLVGEIGASVEAARALTREAARRHDDGEDIQRLAAAARIVAARTARTVTSDGLQVFGSYGVVRGSEIERLYREGKFFEVGQGVVELQRLIVARSLLAEARNAPMTAVRRRGVTDLTGRIALVTGAASGIGRATAESLAERGAIVVVSDLDADGCADVVREIEGRGLAASPRTLDVTSSGAVDAAIDDIVTTHGRLDVLVNNAGLLRTPPGTGRRAREWDRQRSSGEDAVSMGTTVRTTDELWRLHMSVMVDGVFFCTRAALRHMEGARAGAPSSTSRRSARSHPRPPRRTTPRQKPRWSRSPVRSPTRSRPIGIRVNVVACRGRPRPPIMGVAPSDAGTFAADTASGRLAEPAGDRRGHRVPRFGRGVLLLR